MLANVKKKIDFFMRRRSKMSCYHNYHYRVSSQVESWPATSNYGKRLKLAVNVKVASHLIAVTYSIISELGKLKLALGIPG